MIKSMKHHPITWFFILTFSRPKMTAISKIAWRKDFIADALIKTISPVSAHLPRPDLPTHTFSSPLYL
jgi:hypothetical protein